MESLSCNTNLAYGNGRGTFIRRTIGDSNHKLPRKRGRIYAQRTYAVQIPPTQFSDWKHFARVETSKSGEADILYKPYMNFLCETLLQWDPDLKEIPMDPQLKMQISNKGPKGAEIRNWLLSTNKLRRVRMTYFDAGAAGQAFNSLLYPDYSLDLPLLGIDLLSFGSKKVLCAIDFHPLFQDHDYLEKHTQQLVTIHESFQGYCSRMSSRYFDESCFFSKHLIFFRSSLGSKEPHLQVPSGKFYQVYLAYVKSYFKHLCTSKENHGANFMALTVKRQAMYDQYFAKNDPANRIFDKYFGHEWSKQFCEEFLFPGIKLI